MKKIIILTPVVMKRIAKYISKGYLKSEIAVKIGISRQTLYRWEKVNPKLKALFIEQTLLRTETFKEEILEIADDKSDDLITDESTGRKYPNAANVSRSTLQIKTREKIMKYDNPEKFGDKSSVDITSNGESLFTGLSIIFGKDEDDE